MNIGALPQRFRPFSHTESCGSENKKYFGEDTSRGENNFPLPSHLAGPVCFFAGGQ